MFWSGVIPRGLNLRMNDVKVGFPLPPTLDCHHARLLQFSDQLGHTHPAHAHVLGQSVLARKTKVVMPRSMKLGTWVKPACSTGFSVSSCRFFSLRISPIGFICDMIITHLESAGGFPCG